MKKNIKTIWQGKIGLHEKYKNQMLELSYKGNQEQYLGQKMTIQDWHNGQISDRQYPEKQGMGFYRLIYFDWKPDKEPQQTLL